MKNNPNYDLNKEKNIQEWGSWKHNVRDQFKSKSLEEIKGELKETQLPCSILMSQISGDFNFSSLIRSANSFNLKNVYYYGTKHYNKIGACGTYKYTDVSYLRSIDEIKELKKEYTFVALENNIDKPVQDITSFIWNTQTPTLICVGEENCGLQPEILELCDFFIEIPGRGSVRSLNAAVAATLAMYDYYSKYSK